MKFFNSVAKCGFKRRTAAAKSGCYSPLGAARSIRVILFIMSLFLCLQPSHPYRRGGGRRPPGLLVSPRVLHVVLYLFIIYYFSLFWLYTYMQFLWAIQCLAFIYLCGPLGPFRIMLCIDVTVRFFFFSCAGAKGLPSTKMPCSVWPQHRIRLEKIAK